MEQERKVNILDQMEESDFFLYMALFEEQFLANKEELETTYAPMKDKYVELCKGEITDNSPIALMFMAYSAGINKGLEINCRLEKLAEDKIERA